MATAAAANGGRRRCRSVCSRTAEMFARLTSPSASAPQAVATGWVPGWQVPLNPPVDNIITTSGLNRVTHSNAAVSAVTGPVTYRVTFRRKVAYRVNMRRAQPGTSARPARLALDSADLGRAPAAYGPIPKHVPRRDAGRAPIHSERSGSSPVKASDLGRSAPHLSHREIEVLMLSSEGRSAKQIAYQLRISRETVNTLFDRARTKLDAATTTHAVAKAIRQGLLEPHSSKDLT